MPRLRGPITPRLIEPGTDRVARNHEQRLREIQSIPIVGGKLIKGVLLPDNAVTAVPHGFGRPVSVFVSPPRKRSLAATPDCRILRVDGSADDPGTTDPSQYVLLIAAGYGGGGVTVDLWVF